MQDLIKNFGVNPYLLSAQIVNFLIILYILKRFAYKPILKLLDKRKQTIEEGQKNAEKATIALQKALDEEKKILRNAQSEAKNILSDANKQADTIITSSHEKGKKQVEKLLADARDQLEKERKETEKRLASQITTLAVDILQKSLKGFFSEKEQKEVMKKAAETLKKK